MPTAPCSGTQCTEVGGQSYRGNVKIPASYCKTVPSPPKPTPGPSPVLPPEQTCAATGADVEYWESILKPHGSTAQVDFSPKACGADLVAKINNGNCGSKCCELTSEKGFAACEQALFGRTVYTDQNGALLHRMYQSTTAPEMVFVYPDNNNIVRIVSGNGRIKVCGTKGGPSSCVQADVAATVPPCVVPAGSNQGCVIR
jgi:hypothetical protein